MIQRTWCCLPLLALAAAEGQAQPAGGENVIFGYAQVLRVDPVYERVIVTDQVEQCDGEVVSADAGRSSRLEAAMQSLSGGSARRAQAAADMAPDEAVLGAGCHLVEVDRELNRLAGYDVEYRYRGDYFISRMQRDPGDRLQVRVSVAPAADGGGL